MVDFAMVEQMSLASCEYEKGINEFVKAGFTEVASVIVKPPRVLESKAAFECKVKQVIQMSQEGGSPNLVICEVVLAHFSEAILDKNGRIDQTKTVWVAIGIAVHRATRCLKCQSQAFIKGLALMRFLILLRMIKRLQAMI
jgi:flavin reductase (DIM6/NTAB) family NADH-FMN oxidoreductase RutF